MDEMTERLEEYLAWLEEGGQKVPGGRFNGKPHLGLISAASGLDYKFLFTRAARRRISVAAEALGVDATQWPPRLRGEKLFEQNSSLVANYLKRLGEGGLTLPEDPRRRCEILFRQAEIESGLTTNTLTLKKPEADGSDVARLRAMLRESVPRLGLSVRILPQFPGHAVLPITYERLLERGTEARRSELKGKPSADQQLYNTKSALRSFCKAQGLSVTAEVGVEFVTDFKKSTSGVMRRLKSVGSRRKFQTEVRWWFDFYQKLVKEQSLPEDFRKALVHLVDRSGLGLSVFAKLVEVPFVTFSLWYSGEAVPSVRSLRVISRIESLSRLPAGVLTNQLRHAHLGWRVKPSQLPDFLRGKNKEEKRLTYRVCPHLPEDFCELPAERQRKIFEEVRAWLTGAHDPHTRMLAELQKLPYALKQWPPSLEKEFDRLASFKTADRQPVGMRRNGRWRQTTRAKMRREFSYFFGALRLPSDATDERMRGLSVPESDLTIALIACPLVIDWYIRFKCEARSSYTNWPFALLLHLRSMLLARTGWLRQQPQLASRLRPVSCVDSSSGKQIDLVSPDLVAWAREDWDGVCDEAVEQYKQMLKEVEPLMKAGRDPFRRIKGIVDMDDPMEAFPVLLRGMRDEMPNRDTQPTRYHIAVRNCALVILVALTGLRRGTVWQLDYTGDDKGHLTLQDGGYVLKAPRAFFKNENSQYFGPKNAKEDYVMRLPEALGVTDTLSEYLNVSRPYLLNRYHPDCKEQPLLASARGPYARVQPGLVTYIYAEVTGRHLAENPWRGTGMPEVGRHSVHSARHVRGTAAVKKTGSFQMAADANQQSEKAARIHYARYAPKDRNSRVNVVLYPGG